MRDLAHSLTGKRERWFVYVSILLYLGFCVVWEFLSDAPWDDDCVGRYFNTKNAINDPIYFVSLWNRPLFTILFFLPFQISKHMILLMAVLSAFSSWLLFRYAKYEKIQNAHLVVPLLLFQSFFFVISKSSLSEPLASMLIVFGLLLYKQKNFFWFAIVGSLLPLARLELVLLLILWALILYKNKMWKYIPLLGVSCLLWSIAGTLIDGDLFWLYENTLGKENDTNRYGHTSFWHYFQRYIYVVGPAVFYFFFIGFWESLFKRKVQLLIIGQFVLGFGIYVLFSWKLNLGQAAGFLRHLIVLSPLTAILSIQGYNYWIEAIASRKRMKTAVGNEPLKTESFKGNLEEKIEDIKSDSQKRNLKSREIRHLISMEKRKHFEKIEMPPELKASKKQGGNKPYYRIILYSIVLAVLSWFFFSKKLVGHHSISQETNFVNLSIVGAFLLLLLILGFIVRQKGFSKTLDYVFTIIVALSVMGHTLITEKPDSHQSPERDTMSRISKIHVKANLEEYELYVNHNWFYWANGIERNYSDSNLVTMENLNNAPDSSIIIWENHYSHRLRGDVQSSFFENKKEFVELVRELSSDGKFIAVIYQKLKHRNDQKLVELYDRLIQSDSSFSSIYLNRGNVKYNTLKQVQAAIEDYDKAIEINPKHANAYFNKGLVLFQKGNYKESQKLFSKVIELSPSYYHAHYNIGICMSKLGDEKGALKKFDKVIELNPKYSDAFYNRGILKLRASDRKGGCEDLESALKLGKKAAKAMIDTYCGPQPKK